MTPVDFNLKHDSLKIRRYYVEKEWKPETEYQLLIDSMVYIVFTGCIITSIREGF